MLMKDFASSTITSVDARHLETILSERHAWVIVGTQQITILKVLLCNAQSEIFHHISVMPVYQQLLSRKLHRSKISPTPEDDTVIGSSPPCSWKLFDDTASAHILKDYSVFGFVPRLTFQNETKGQLCNLELVCFNVVVQTQLLTGYMEMAISICKV